MYSNYLHTTPAQKVSTLSVDRSAGPAWLNASRICRDHLYPPATRVDSFPWNVTNSYTKQDENRCESACTSRCMSLIHKHHLIPFPQLNEPKIFFPSSNTLFFLCVSGSDSSPSPLLLTLLLRSSRVKCLPNVFCSRLRCGGTAARIVLMPSLVGGRLILGIGGPASRWNRLPFMLCIDWKESFRSNGDGPALLV